METMQDKYFVAKVQYDLPDENTGKIKKIREEKLVKGFEGFTYDWRITACVESKIDEVFE